MRSILAVLVTLAVLGARTADAGPSDEQKFRSAMGKVALPYGSVSQGKVKALCVCRATGLVGAVEILESLGEFYGICDVPTFDDDGDVIFAAGCNDWTPLVK